MKFGYLGPCRTTAPGMPCGRTTAPAMRRGRTTAPSVARASKMAAPMGGSGLDTDTGSDSDSGGEAAARFREAAWDCTAQAAVARAEPRSGEGGGRAGLFFPAAACPPFSSPPRRSGPAPRQLLLTRGDSSLPRGRCQN